MSWSHIYTESYTDVLEVIKKLDGIAVAFNTNVDAIIDFRAQKIAALITKLNIDPLTIYSEIITWKGIIEHPEDFVIALCGCFEKGKASEWLIQNEETYYALLQNLPPPELLRMGGQAGIMANLLAELDVPRVIVHIASLSKELQSLFIDKKNIVIPIYDKNNNLIFSRVKKVKDFDKSLFFHIIAEVKKNDSLNLGEIIRWQCPRDNRFIATFDPPNSELKILEAFQRDIELIAEKINGFIVSGFHMLNLEKIGREEVIIRIKNVLSIVERAKKRHPKLVTHLELCSTKKTFILEQLMKYSIKGEYWDSFGCNERELVEILNIIDEKKLALKIQAHFDQKLIIEACLIVCKNLNLKRLHLHQLGSYLLVVENSFTIDPLLHRKTLCFASLIAAQKVIADKIVKNLTLEPEELTIDKKLSKTFKELNTSLEELCVLSNKQMVQELGIFQLDKFLVIIIPTITIEEPKFTVGLGDTISSSAFAAELAFRKRKLKGNK